MKELTNEERREYAKRAVETRHKRALLKAELHKGSLTASDVLDNLDKYPYMKRMKVSEFMRAHGGIGTATAEKLMSELKIPNIRRLQGLNERKSKELAQVIEQHCK